MTFDLIADMFPEVRPEPASGDTDERYTLPDTLELCRVVADVKEFDLDVAACAEAHCASRWYSREDEGLVRPWFGRVWCNPPWSNIGPWVEKAWARALEMREGERIAMLLPNNRGDQRWWQEHVEPWREGRAPKGTPKGRNPRRRLGVYFLPGRIRFGTPTDRFGVNQGSPAFGCCLLVWRPPRRSEAA